MKIFMRVLAFSLMAGASGFLLWFATQHFDVIETWLATTCILLAVVCGVLAVTEAPFVGQAPKTPCIEPEAIIDIGADSLQFKIIGNIVTFLILAVVAYFLIKCGIDFRGSLESWISTTSILTGAACAVIAFSYQPWDVTA